MNRPSAIVPNPPSDPQKPPPSVLSIDVEDWFHILDVPSTPPLSEWARLPSLVGRDFTRLLDLLDEQKVRATCFFLGWIGERHPHLVKEAAARGHEIASHGYGHRLVYGMSAREFSEDVGKARDLLEQLAGQPVRGYRSPGFSCTEDVPWFFEVLAQAGHSYDSSVFPARRGHGGMRKARLAPYAVRTPSGLVVEFPVTVARVLGKRLCFFGGGYLRLFPYFLIRRMARQVLRENRPVVFYVHPREMNPNHPRLPMSLRRRFKSYVNLRSTEGKLRRLTRDFPLRPFGQIVGRYAEGSAQPPATSGQAGGLKR